MISNPMSFVNYSQLSDEHCHQRIQAVRARLGQQVVMLGHHYQRSDIYQYADLTGDSLKLARQASETNAEYIVFCGVHFMAEVADILTNEHQQVILPNMAASCTMADMVSLDKAQRSWDELNSILDAENVITPVTYMNSAANLKAFCGRHGGIVCTSSNAKQITEWAFAQREKVLMFPDQHLGRWTGHSLGLPFDAMPVWDPDLEMGGLTIKEIQKAKILLWKGHCSVHQVFQPSDIHRFRSEVPNGLVIAHPECHFDICALADFVGSTEYIAEKIKSAAPGTDWLVATEQTFVKRLAEEVAHEGKRVRFMSALNCMCSTMQRTDPQHLAWALENLANKHIVNRIRVPEHETQMAKLALEKMLNVS